jgi:hypothetical protein
MGLCTSPRQVEGHPGKHMLRVGWSSSSKKCAFASGAFGLLQPFLRKLPLYEKLLF